MNSLLKKKCSSDIQNGKNGNEGKNIKRCVLIFSIRGRIL